MDNGKNNVDEREREKKKKEREREREKERERMHIQIRVEDCNECGSGREKGKWKREGGRIKWEVTRVDMRRERGREEVTRWKILKDK